MAGVMDKFLNIMKLNDEEDYYEDDYYDEEEDEPVVEKKSSKIKNINKYDAYDEMDKPKKSSSSSSAAKVTQMRQPSKKSSSGSGMEVCVIKPTSVEEAREITETLLANRTVVLNMEGLDVDIAQRIIDFTSGSCYAINGNLQKISHFIFIITPASVDISGDFQDLLNGSFEVKGMK